MLKNSHLTEKDTSGCSEVLHDKCSPTNTGHNMSDILDVTLAILHERHGRFPNQSVPQYPRPVKARSDQNNTHDTPIPAPTHEQVAIRAYEIYIDSGCVLGRCVSNWLNAEQELGRRDALVKAMRKKIQPPSRVYVENVMNIFSGLFSTVARGCNRNAKKQTMPSMTDSRGSEHPLSEKKIMPAGP